MSRIKRVIIYVVGWSLFVSLFYVVGVASLQLFAVVSVNAKRPVAADPVNFFQRNYYMIGIRHIWQEDPTCAQADRALIYKPKNGTCYFANVEFDTTLNFDDLGRAVPGRPEIADSGNGIAVLGDSYAMGWGVNDNETFSSVLQQHTTRPVYNLGVSSYGTERELKRLVVSGVIDKVDTVIIQYCENDLGENAESLTEADFQDMADFFQQQLNAVEHEGLGTRLRFTQELMESALTSPFVKLGELTRSEETWDFSTHEQYLRDTLQRYQDYLHDKRVLVFYTNAYGKKFVNFPDGQDSRLPYVSYFDPGLTQQDYYVIDDHLTAGGHRRVGEYIATLLQPRHP